MKTTIRLIKSLMLAVMVMAFTLMSAKAETELTLWSHWADHESKRAFVEGAARAFEEANPGVKINITWYEKKALYAALKTSLRAGQAQDIFYAEPNQVEYLENKLLYDLSDSISWDKVEGWAKDSWSYEGGVYGLPLEAWTVEMYYDKKAIANLGIELPANKQLSQAQFLDMVKAAAEKGITPMSLGVGDRPYPGAFLTHEALLQTLGLEDYDKLLNGELDWGDPRVRQALEFVKSLVDAKALPNSFSTLNLGESHFYFHTKPGAATFLMGSFYPSRAFNPPDKGGQPKGFELGVMMYPALDGAACPNCKSITIGGSYVVNAASENAELAGKFLNSFATPEMANKWLDTALVQTGIKADPSKIKGPNAVYFKELAEIDSMCEFYDALPMGVMTGEAREVFTQVVNQAFPAGLLGVDDVIEKMNATRK